MKKRALITGVTGQDGAYLAKLLLKEGYQVSGAVRRTSSPCRWRLREMGIERDIDYVLLDLGDDSNIVNIIKETKVDEFYNLAAQSDVAASYTQPIYTSQINGVSVMRILEALRIAGHETRFYQASSSEMFGLASEAPQTEQTGFHPRSPYGIAKVYAHWATVNCREAYGLFACSGISFNHESPFRGPEFVTRKIAIGLAEIRAGRRDTIPLGNLDAKRDWGFAGDYVRGMWGMLQADQPDDYVLATGCARSVRELVRMAGQYLDYDVVWQGEGESEIGIDRKSGRSLVRVDPALYRPAEILCLVGDARKAALLLNWRPAMSFERLVELMVRAEVDRVDR